MTKNVEGITSPQVPDSTKIVCPRCNSSLVYLSSTMDDPNDIAKDREFAAYLLTITGGSIQGFVALCHTCGNEFVPLFYITDVATFDGATECAMSNLDAAVANGLAGMFVIVLIGADIGKYVAIASNTLAAPTVITLAFNVNTNGDGSVIITNIEPIGLTKIVA
ncbi:hypothetical protein LCGC14_1811200 [marine sediment metagenome]|uniref:Uncharacterized protein n=1 Tax=marine sediment metagenome TaxID=412755 RepID=A0A0F9GLW9_9ZZZZ